jgi:hypothetical protein
LANADATRSPSAIIDKDQKKADLISNARMLARIIQANPSVTNAQRSDLGLTVRDPDPSPIPVPSSDPLIEIKSIEGRTVRVRLIDRANPTRADGRLERPGLRSSAILARRRRRTSRRGSSRGTPGRRSWTSTSRRRPLRARRSG